MNPLIILTGINTLSATWLLCSCLRRVQKDERKKLNLALAFIFMVFYAMGFYSLQMSLPSQIKYWYKIDMIMNAIAGLGILSLGYNGYKKLKPAFYPMK